MSCCIGCQAPNFVLNGAQNSDLTYNWSLENQKDNWVCLIFYPMDFTFVCPTELIAFSERLEEFNFLGCEIVGISGDSPYIHLNWLSTPHTQGGLENKVQFPLLSDVDREVMKAYGVYNPDKSGLDYAQAFRGLFLIDPNGKLRHVCINDNGVARSVDETLRVLKALQYYDMYGNPCPEGWKSGRAAIVPTRDGIIQYLTKEMPKIHM
ncbi:hypothetical protein WA158_003067 [Blastocystis sp. Blastoise]